MAVARSAGSDFSWTLDPGAYAPGFMLTSASRTYDFAPRLLLGINLIDHVPVLLVDHSSLHLQRRRQLAACEREFFLQQGDSFYLFELRQVSGAGRNLPLEKIHDAPVVTELLARVQIVALVRRVTLKLLPVGHD